MVHEGVWVGRVTSARRSAAVGATVGLAWVPAGWANDGNGVRDPVRSQPCRGARGAAAVLRSRRGEAPVVSDHRVAILDRAGSDVPAAAALAARVDPRRLRVGRDDRGRSRDGPVLRRSGRGSARPSPAPSAWPMSRCCRRSTSGATWSPALSSARERRVVARIAKDWAMVFAAPGPVADRVAAMQAAVGTAAMVTDVTHLYAGFALAGPALSDALARLTSWDPSALDVGQRDRRADRRRPRDRAAARGVGAGHGGLGGHGVRAVRVAVDPRGRRTPGRRARRLGRAPRAGVALLMHPIRYFQPWTMWRRHELKPTYDVVIVGGGAHGLAIAYELAKRGVKDVAVLEKRLHRRRRQRAQHHDHPRELPHARRASPSTRRRSGSTSSSRRSSTTTCCSRNRDT